MADKIEDLLHRRSDLSTFLVHFTKGNSESDAEKNLLDILDERTIEARASFGMAGSVAEKLEDAGLTQRVACFTETPLEHCWMMVREIERRAWKFRPYGLVFGKKYARIKGCNPVWYLDISARGKDWLTKPVNKIVESCEEYIAEGRPIDSHARFEILKLTPFMEQMGPTKLAEKEFWWEREWRHVGDFEFDRSKLVAVFGPERRREELASAIKKN